MPVIGPSCTAQEHHTIMAYLRALEAQNVSYDAGYLKWYTRYSHYGYIW